MVIEHATVQISNFPNGYLYKDILCITFYPLISFPPPTGDIYMFRYTDHISSDAALGLAMVVYRPNLFSSKYRSGG